MRRASAFTLIEIIVTLVVVGIAATALMSVFASNVRSSADPMIQQQAVTIAEAYIEEILLKAYEDPDPAVTEMGMASTEGLEGMDRNEFDDVQDYNHLQDMRVRDQFDVEVMPLDDYEVTVTVQGTTLNGQAAMQIDVIVTHPAIQQIQLTAYRTNY